MIAFSAKAKRNKVPSVFDDENVTGPRVERDNVQRSSGPSPWNAYKDRVRCSKLTKKQESHQKNVRFELTSEKLTS